MIQNFYNSLTNLQCLPKYKTLNNQYVLILHIRSVHQLK